MSPSASWSSGGQAVQLRTCASLLPPLKLGDAAQCTLPPLSKTQPFQDSSFCGLENLEKLASLASSSEKLVSSKVSTSGGVCAKRSWLRRRPPRETHQHASCKRSAWSKSTAFL